MPRLVVALPRPPLPALSGGETRVASLLSRLSGRFRLELYCLSEPGCGREEAAAAALAERAWGARLSFVPRTPGVRAPGGLPSIAASYHEPEMSRALRRAVSQGGPCLAQLEFSQMAQYAAELAPLAPVLLTEHDAGLLSSASTYENPAGASPERRREQARLARRHLDAAYRACDRVVAVSEADARRLRRLCPGARVECVPTGVDTRRFAFRGLAGRVPGLVAFLGHYPHYPNEEAALRLCREVLPRLRASRPDAAVRLIGSAPTPAVRALAGPRVEVCGTLADVRPPLSSARAFVAPMRLGRGIKGKLLECFAVGTPVVATPTAVEALEGARHGVHLLVASGPRALARAAARVLSDDGLAARLAAAARAYVEERFDWDRQAARLSGIYETVARERGLRARPSARARGASRPRSGAAPS